MKLFRKRPPAAPNRPIGRRRPLDESSSDPQALLRPAPTFSYSAQRAHVPGNTGRRDQAEISMGRSRNSATSLYVAAHRLLLGCVAACIVVAGIYLLSLNTKPHIVLLQDDATAYFLHGASVYSRTAQQSLNQSLFNRNKLTIDTAAVRSKLLSTYPEVKNVSIALPIFGHQPQIYIEPYKPSFILTTNTSDTYLLDATGRALVSTSQIPQISKLGLATLQDHTGATVKLGTRAVPSTTVTFTQTVVAALRAAKVTPSALVLPPAAYELDVSISGSAYYVKFNLQNDALEQAGTYLATAQHLAGAHITPAQYIDVRVPERAYYK